jgi:hypothetical protein
MGMAVLRAAWVAWATWGCKRFAYFNIRLNEEAWQKCWAFLLVRPEWGIESVRDIPGRGRRVDGSVE